MTEVQHNPESPNASESKLIRVAIWVAIGALIAAAIVCVVWVLLGSQNGIIGRAFLTILLLAAFAGVAILDARLAANRPAWFALTSMIVWVVTLLLGAFLIWMPESGSGLGFGLGLGRFMSFLLIVLILQLALLHLRLFVKAYQRFVTPFTMIVTVATVALVAVLAFMLVFPLAFGEYLTFTDTYWRWVVAIAILAAVGTALVPLVNALFAPKKPRAAAAQPAPYGYAPAPQWPTYVDGVTPLPVLPDGSPDWNAYYTGYPSANMQAIAPVAPVAVPVGEPDQAWAEQQAWADPSQPQPQPQSEADPAQPQTEEDADQPDQPAPPPQPAPPVAPGYEGYPPPPPLPPRP